MQLIIAGALAVAAMVLFVADRYTTMPTGRRSPRMASTESAIVAEIDSLLGRHRIPRAWIRSRQIKTPEKTVIRVERRIEVPADFLSIEFNLELSHLLSRYGARVVATEHTDERYVTMHVIVGGLIVQSLAFMENPDLKWENTRE